MHLRPFRHKTLHSYTHKAKNTFAFWYENFKYKYLFPHTKWQLKEFDSFHSKFQKNAFNTK